MFHHLWVYAWAVTVMPLLTLHPDSLVLLLCWSSLPNTAREANCELWWFIFTAQLMRFRITMETRLRVCLWGHFQKCLAEQGKTYTGCGHHYHVGWSPNRTRVRHQHSPFSALPGEAGWPPGSPLTMTSLPWWMLWTVGQNKPILHVMLSQIFWNSS